MTAPRARRKNTTQPYPGSINDARQKIAALHVGAQQKLGAALFLPDGRDQLLPQFPSGGIMGRDLGRKDGHQHKQHDQHRAQQRRRLPPQFAEKVETVALPELQPEFEWVKSLVQGSALSFRIQRKSPFH
jgi:hypothetical protein